MKAAIYHKGPVERAGVSLPRLSHRAPMIKEMLAAAIAEARYYRFQAKTWNVFFHAI